MKSVNDRSSDHEFADSAGVDPIMAAARALAIAVGAGEQESVRQARRNLRLIVQAANDSGVSWQTIGEVLGLRRGAAYKRFRRQVPAVSRDASADPHAGLPLAW